MTHTLESLHIFLESNYKEEKLAEKVRESIEFNIYLCVTGISIVYILHKQCDMWQEKFFIQSPE